MSAVLESTANQIILAALLDSGIIRPDQVPSADDTATALARLNSLTKRWQAQGHHLWAQTEGIVFTDQGKESYLLGPSGDEATTADDFIGTTTTAALAALATAVTVADTTGMLGAAELITIDPISTQFWTATDATVTDTGNVITLTNSGAAAGFADFDLTCTVGETYRVRNGYTVGTGTEGAAFSVRDPVADTETVTSGTLTTSQTVNLTFTATQETMTFRFSNLSTDSGDTSILTSLSQIDTNSGDNIGIKQDDNTRHWTKIVEVLTSTTLEIETGMISAAASGAQVFTFTDFMERPMRIYNERTETIGQNNEIPAYKWTRQEYMQQTIKQSQGTIIQLYYNPRLVDGELFIWQTASDCNQVANFTFDRPLQVSEDQLDSPDFPSEWFDALKWNLALQLLSGYSVDPNTAQMVMGNAQTSLEDALDFDEETGSLYVMPDSRGR